MSEGGPEDPRRRELLRWAWRLPVLATLGALGYGAYEGSRILFGKESPAGAPHFEPRSPVPVGRLDSFAAPWDAEVFAMDGIPAIALRLPEPIAGGLEIEGLHFAAFSRVCTHQGCIVSLNRDTEAIAFAFNYRSPDPALVCRCHLSVFAPAQGGRAVSGPAVRPLPRVRLERRGDELYAVGIERPA